MLKVIKIDLKANYSNCKSSQSTEKKNAEQFLSSTGIFSSSFKTKRIHRKLFVILDLNLWMNFNQEWSHLTLFCFYSQNVNLHMILLNTHSCTLQRCYENMVTFLATTYWTYWIVKTLYGPLVESLKHSFSNHETQIWISSWPSY